MRIYFLSRQQASHLIIPSKLLLRIYATISARSERVKMEAKRQVIFHYLKQTITQDFSLREVEISYLSFILLLAACAQEEVLLKREKKLKSS